MSRFILSPCKFREDRVVPTGEDPVSLDLRELMARFVPSGNKAELLKLRALRLGSYVGHCKGGRTGREVLFVLASMDRTNKVTWLLKGDPSFPSRVLDLYRVDVLDWGSRVEEVESGKKDRIPSEDRKRPGLAESLGR